MRNRNTLAALALGVFGLAGCSGGEGPLAGLGAGTCTDTSFCVVSCSLGCDSSASSCNRTAIAVNEQIRVTFSQPVDPDTVSASTFSIQAANGLAPVGDLTIENQGTTVVFTPEVRTVSGQTVFGFVENEDYLLTLPAVADGGPVLRALSGEPLTTQLRCALVASQGVVDLDNQPPRAVSMMPANGARDVETDATITVEFSEVLDISPFIGGSTATSPVIFQVRDVQLRDPNDPSSVVCDGASSPVLIPGVPTASTNNGRTTVRLAPAVALPARSCVEVIVTTDVRDLAGTRAERQRLSFFVGEGSAANLTVTERFLNASQLDSEVSNATWSGGEAVFKQVGGSGIHGEFDLRIATNRGGSVFEIDTDTVTMIPRGLTLYGIQDEPVVNGNFNFSRMVVPSGVTVNFVGSIPPKIRVRGDCVIEGTLTVNGQAVDASFDPSAVNQGGQFLPRPGQDGGLGGAGGGQGGQGADAATGQAAQCTPQNTGRAGDDLQVPGTSDYINEPTLTSTGGEGSMPWPMTCRWADVSFQIQNSWSGWITAGGGGGSFLDPGGAGEATQTPTNIAGQLGPSVPSAPAIAYRNPGSRSSLEHYLVGGSGGGGGATHTFRVFRFDNNKPWLAGGAGSGGGGALAFRVGGDMTISGSLQARGGDGIGLTNSIDSTVQSPGGGGSGGSLLLQVLGRFSSTGTIDVRGGLGSFIDFNWFGDAFSTGGQGSGGYVRLEQPLLPNPNDLGVVDGLPSALSPNDTVGELRPVDEDPEAGFISRWYATRQIRAPLFTGFQLTISVDGVPVTYDDDNLPGPSDPIVFLIQGAEVDAQTGEASSASIGDWVTRVSSGGGVPALDDQDATGFRFAIQLRETNATVTIQELRVNFRG